MELEHLDDDELVGKLLRNNRDIPWYFKVKYIDDDVVLANSVDSKGRFDGHSILSRDMFDEGVEANFYVLSESQNPVEAVSPDDTEFGELNMLLDVDGVGESVLESLYESGYETLDDIRDAPKAALRKINGVGSTIVDRIKADIQDEEETKQMRSKQESVEVANVQSEEVEEVESEDNEDVKEVDSRDDMEEFMDDEEWDMSKL